MVVRLKVSEQDYIETLTGQLPSYEFVNGEVVQKPLTKRSHSLVARRLGAALIELEQRAGGYFAWEPTTNLSTTTIRLYRVPDLAYWAPDRPTGDEIFLPPTLAVEIRSPGETMAAQRSKCREYRSAGTDVAWLIDPETRTAEVFEAGHDGLVLAGDDALQSTALPAFRLPLADLFSELK